MKTAEEVAEEITLWTRQDRYATAIILKDAIAQALTAFAEERLKEAARHSGEDAKEHYLEGKIDGRNEGLEEAANCLTFRPGEDRLTFDPACIEELKTQPEVAMRKLLAGFAEEIRALKSKP